MAEVFGIPVSGKPMKGRRGRMPQRPLSDLREAFEALIADERVVEFGWEQYTPYFNDGDVCEFGVYTPWIRTVDDDEDADRYDLEISNVHPTLGNMSYEWFEFSDAEQSAYRAKWKTNYAPAGECRSASKEAKYPDLYELAKKLNVDASSYKDALYDAFGDHARVTVTKTGIQIDEYDHD